MAERSLRGTRLGATSYENDEGVEPAARLDVTYDCPAGHSFTMPFSVEADVPARWVPAFSGCPAPATPKVDLETGKLVPSVGPVARSRRCPMREDRWPCLRWWKRSSCWR
jgi:hypothetical protein